jgi:hypothetical protein
MEHVSVYLVTLDVYVQNDGRESYVKKVHTACVFDVEK